MFNVLFWRTEKGNIVCVERRNQKNLQFYLTFSEREGGGCEDYVRDKIRTKCAKMVRRFYHNLISQFINKSDAK
jgi:hypothetical protein